MTADLDDVLDDLGGNLGDVLDRLGGDLIDVLDDLANFDDVHKSPSR